MCPSSKILEYFYEDSQGHVVSFERFHYNINIYSPHSRKTRSVDMKISYKKLWVLLIQKEISKATLRKDVGIAADTMSKLNKTSAVAEA